MSSSNDESDAANDTASSSPAEDDRRTAVGLREFLDFLILAYRIDDALTTTSTTTRDGPGNDRVDWTELSRNDLFVRLSNNVDGPHDPGKTTTVATAVMQQSAAAAILRRKLKDVMNEGVLDSVLPFIVRKPSPVPPPPPPPPPQPPPNGTCTTNEPFAFSSKAGRDPPPNNKTCGVKQKCTAGNDSNATRTKGGDTEIEINVCDAIQKVKRVFRCPKRLLVSKMGYFSEVTKGQRLEDIDISVHCEIPIFDWLIKWVKKDSKPKNEWPTLDNGNVVPILVSASFLQMEPLFQECLAFCKSNIDDLLSSSASFGCVNDGVITRLLNQFNNGEVENMVDTKDKLKSRLFAKLIWDLCKRDPNSKLGHYSTLAYAYYCCRCNTVLVPSVAGRIPCKPPTFKIAQNGSVIACHLRDPKWTLNDHVKSLFSKHKCWRTVYWLLWSECHFMRCSRCRHMYPIKNQRWCQFHTQSPQYHPVENNRYLHYPIGRYPCCGERAFKFEPIKSPFGCHYREHIPTLEHAAEIETYRVMQTFPSLITVDPPTLFANEFSKILNSHAANDQQTAASWTGGESHRFTPFIVSSTEGPSFRKSQFLWDNIVTGTSSNKRPLLTELWDKPFTKRPTSPSINDNGGVYEATEVPPNEIHSSFGSSFEEVEDSLSSFSDSDSTHSERTANNGVKQQKVKRFSKAIRTLKQRYRYSGTYQWSSTAPMRCNQDNQREYEERCFRQIARHLLHESGNADAVECSRILAVNVAAATAAAIADPGQRAGGYFVKLESQLLSKLDPKNAQRPSTVDAVNNKGQSKTKLKKTSRT